MFNESVSKKHNSVSICWGKECIYTPDCFNFQHNYTETNIHTYMNTYTYEREEDRREDDGKL